MDERVEVWVKATGQPQIIPAHWLDDPTLSEPFSKTKPAKAADTPKEK